MQSIINNERECLVCGITDNLHKHHIYYGTANRKLSEKYGCWCYLCAKHHNMSKEGVHFNKALDTKLKVYTQKRFNEAYPELNFRKIFGKNYLEE